MNYNDVLDFWFNTLSPADWWKKDNTLDNLINVQFLELHTQASQGELVNWRSSALGSLAEVILLDQFSRNIFRDTPQSFSFDGMALLLAQFAIHNKFDEALDPKQRSFLYMPFMHSESLIIHKQAKQLFSQPQMEANYEFELKHAAIIERFGRYPHRNAILGRQSTPEELEFLKQPNSSF
ncbi:DUF924 family protein [Legionella sp. W05-934-2]|jgi:uncharacterized protein (DUF924 family)|uniref:DUF924 family protein n=1 Tax=Legionella sp. W05-934-2 TaxID=1198649 RepID=UPI0034627491